MENLHVLVNESQELVWSDGWLLSRMDVIRFRDEVLSAMRWFALEHKVDETKLVFDMTLGRITFATVRGIA
jgi:hypothetical protein